MKSCVPKRRPDLEIRETDGEMVVLDLRREKIHKFNHSAALIFAACDGASTLEQIIDRVVAAYGAPVEVVRQDVTKAVREFDQLGLLASTRGLRGE